MSMSEFNALHPTVTLTTDFGTHDWYVGVMKGVMTQHARDIRLIDISHDISPGNIHQAAFVLHQSLPWFPDHTVHLAVVDPGVGTSRKGLIIETPLGWLVGPDNGLLSWAVLHTRINRMFALNPDRFEGTMSHTFHGRDLFAPAAVRLACGENPANLGDPCDEMTQLEWPKYESLHALTRGHILYEDRFGNLITNLPIGWHDSDKAHYHLKRTLDSEAIRVLYCDTYDHAPEDQLAIIPGSTGFLEFAFKGQNAASKLSWKAGTPFELTD